MPSTPTSDHLRLMSKVARMYHERGFSQVDIAAALRISQSRVSRLLAQATNAGIVRTVVTLPSGVHTDLEESLQERFELLDCVVVDVDGIFGDLLPALGSAAGVYLADTLRKNDRIGISSWSASLIATVNVLSSRLKPTAESVVQLVGGLGNPQVQVAATRLLDTLATLAGAEPVFLPTPARVPDPRSRSVYLQEPTTLRAQSAWRDLSVALVGIGALEPSPLLQSSGNAGEQAQWDELAALGAVGDVCLRYVDADGALIDSAVNDSVLGIPPETFLRIPRRIAVAGGPEKTQAIRAAMQGRWINVLITDSDTARTLSSG